MATRSPLSTAPAVAKLAEKPCPFCTTIKTRSHCPSCRTLVCAICSLPDSRHRCPPCAERNV